MADDEGPAPKTLTKNPLGPSGRAVAANIEQLRTAQNLTFVALSEQLETLGRPIPPLGLRKIVAETRRVDADDLVAIAVVLNVSPASLLMPNLSAVAEGDFVDVTGWHKPVPAQHVWKWLTATRPFVSAMLGSFVDRALPSWERDKWRIEAHARVLDELQGGGRRRKQADGDD